MLKPTKTRIFDAIFLVIFILCLAGIVHFFVTNPLGPARLLYYVQAPLIKWSTRCSQDSPEWMYDLQNYATSQMSAPASQLAYIAPNGDLNHCETGWKDGVFGEKPLSPDARFRFASTTKIITAAAIIDLVNEGKLGLSSKIVDVLRQQKGELKDSRVAEISIAHLLSHRGGWDRERGQDLMFMRNHKPWCPGTPEKLLGSTLTYGPGDTERYSNLGYCLLGLAIEEVTGQSYRRYIANRYDFGASTLRFVEGDYESDEVEYDFRFENFYTENYHQQFDFLALSSSAGLSGSASDFALLISKLVKTRPMTILDGPAGKDCHSDKIQKCFGYGVYRYQPSEEDMLLFIHGGKLPGNPSAVIIDPKGGILVWVGAGGPRPGTSARQFFYDKVREALNKHY